MLVVLTTCHIDSFSCAVCQINQNIYSAIGLKNGTSYTPEEEINDEDEDNDTAEEERLVNTNIICCPAAAHSVIDCTVFINLLCV